jgi:hypothetical protein
LWGKKDARCDADDPADRLLGSVWDHVALDTETKFAVTVIPGKRGVASIRRAVKDFAVRTDGILPGLVTTDFYKPYRDVLLEVYGTCEAVPRRHALGRLPKPCLVPPPDLVYAVVQKIRRKGRVVQIVIRQIFGTPDQLEQALRRSSVSHKVNVSFVERYNATDRHLNSRKVRKAYTFSKDPQLHEAATYWSQGVYNFCRLNRALTLRGGTTLGQRTTPRSPAMAQGITNHIWTVKEFVCHQACPHGTLL